MMKRILLGAATLAIALPATAQMQPPQTPVAPIAPGADVTHTRDQAIAKVREHFTKMDANRDGFVAADEIQSMRGMHQGMRREMVERRGRDGERMAMRDPAADFDRLDANKDGSISRDEFGKGREMRVERKIVINRAPGSPGAGFNGQHRRMMKMHRMGGMGGRMMKMADLDKDGRVSLQEATTSALQRFDRVDANRDGRITPDERRQNRDQRKQMRAPTAG